MKSLAIASMALLLWGCGERPITPDKIPPARAANQPAATASQPSDRVEQLIAQLGAENYRQREAATDALARMGEEAVPALRRHEADDDAEVHQRIARLLITLDPPPIRTEQFDSGELQMETVDSAKLAAFLRDLHRRRDYDISCHNGQQTQNSQWFMDWITRTNKEFLRRGYTIDARGEPHAPAPGAKPT